MIPLPRLHITGEDAFDQCVSKVKGSIKKRDLLEIRPIIQSDSKRYTELAGTHDLHQLRPTEGVGGMETKDVIRVYTNQMARKDSSGREIYDLIRSNARGICPICAHGYPETLDHYLPKTKFASLCVTPDNLIPSCSYCNKSKSNSHPEQQVSQTFHPYFDDFEAVDWLIAEVCFTSPLTFQYGINSAVNLDCVSFNRVYKHFNDFKLKTLYEIQSASEFSMIRHQLSERFNDGGAAEVHRHIRECFDSAYRFRRNHWKTAMYKALYLNHGWLGISGIDCP
jgi:5-methylcytosine-specific restriction endonuclease McrA